MGRTTKADVFQPEILEETVRGRFAQKDAFKGSILERSGAVIVRPNFTANDPQMIGSSVRIPYFGTIGEFQPRTDGNSVDFNAIGQMTEDAVIGCDSLGFEVSRWAESSAHDDDVDAYEECTGQIVEAATRAMDKAIISAGSSSPLVLDVHSLTTPRTMDYDLMVEGKTTFWGDDQDDIVAAVIHSRTKADLMKLKYSDGRPMLTEKASDAEFDRFCGIALVLSDKAPLVGSTMTAVEDDGTTPPAVTLSGTPLGPWDLEIDIVTGGASNGTATFRFRVKGQIWSATYAIPNGGGAIALDDSKLAAVLPITGIATADSLVGVNGKTGLTATFANGTYNADNSYTSKARLKTETQLVKKAALAFWYNQNALEVLTDKDIGRHSKLAAMHLYRAAHMYRRTRMGNMPGVVRVQHNVSGYL